MPAQRLLVVAAILGAGVAAGAGAATAESTTTPVRHGAGASNLLLTVSTDRFAPDQSLRTTVLECNPSGGTHPHATAACAQLNQAAGDFDRLPTRQEFCPMIYQPITASAHGVFGTRRIDFQQQYPNRCTLDRNTGQVFDF